MRRLLAAVAALAVAAAVTVGCAGGEAPSDAGDTLTIAAAASLQGAFDEIAAAFEAEHPDVDVQPISYDGSSTLATQLLGGASFDVFAAADEANMARVVDAGLAEDPETFASNTLVIAVPAGNPAAVTTLADLADPATTVVRCAAEVPCGAASDRLLERAGVALTPASLEQNVTAVLTKVAAGEADAGLVYATDAVGEPAVEAIVPAGAADVVNRYPIVALTGARNPAAAAALVAFVAGDRGQAILAERGFGRP
ncbi:molybdate ABC transporter substrate-binding protein [Microbacterium sp. GXF7504]